MCNQQNSNNPHPCWHFNVSALVMLSIGVTSYYTLLWYYHIILRKSGLTLAGIFHGESCRPRVCHCGKGPGWRPRPWPAPTWAAWRRWHSTQTRRAPCSPCTAHSNACSKSQPNIVLILCHLELIFIKLVGLCAFSVVLKFLFVQSLRRCGHKCISMCSQQGTAHDDQDAGAVIAHTQSSDCTFGPNRPPHLAADTMSTNKCCNTALTRAHCDNIVYTSAIWLAADQQLRWHASLQALIGHSL